ncbi:MAG: multiprotein-bridging factor 1 family protein [Planctomycetota bacterium]
MAKMLCRARRDAARPYRLARQRAGLSRRAVAEKLGVTERTLFNWERGHVPKMPAKREAWAEAVGLVAA